MQTRAHKYGDEPDTRPKKTDAIPEKTDASPEKKRKREDQQDLTQPGREKTSRKAPEKPAAPAKKKKGPAPKKPKTPKKKKEPPVPKKKKKPAEEPVEQENAPGPTEQAVDAADVRPRRESSPIVEGPLEVLGHTTPSKSRKPLKAGDERPAPPDFRKNLRCLREDRKLSNDAEQYFLNLRHGDSLRVRGEDGRKSILETFLSERKRKGSEWKSIEKLGHGGFGKVTLWEKSRENGPPFQLALKETIAINPFFADYNSEGNLIRRLNDAGCKNVIKVLDWYRDKKCFHTGLEYAENGDLWQLGTWYKARDLVFPEAFVWHVFHGIANALCYCRHGTNKVHSPTRRPDWDQIIHGDLNPKNVLLAAPDEDCHRLYPCVKLADYGISYTLGGPRSEIQEYWRGHLGSKTPTAFLAPEIAYKVPPGRSRSLREMEDYYSDVYSLGVSIAHMCRHADKHLAEPIRQVLNEKSETWDPSGQRIFSSYYSPQLKELIRRCRSQEPLERPQLYGLYLETKSGMEASRDRAYQAEQESQASVISNIAIHHDKVLYTRDEQNLYDNNMEFQDAYKEANNRRVLDAEDLEVFGSEDAEKKLEDILDAMDDTIITAHRETARSLNDKSSKGNPEPSKASEVMSEDSDEAEKESDEEEEKFYDNGEKFYDDEEEEEEE